MTFLHLNSINKKDTTVADIPLLDELVQEDLRPGQYPNTRSTSSQNSWNETQYEPLNEFSTQINSLVYASETRSEKMFQDILTSLAQSDSMETSEVAEIKSLMMSSVTPSQSLGDLMGTIEVAKIKSPKMRSATPSQSLPHLRDIIPESISLIPAYQHSMKDFEETVPLRLALGQLRNLSQMQKKKSKVGEKRRADLLSTSDVLPFRSGRWTYEETVYAEALLGEFESGILPLTDGTLLRVFVATVLNCDPMRVSKKFAGRGAVKAKLSSMGTLFFKRDLGAVWMLSDEEIHQKQEHFVKLETAFFQKVYESENKKRSTGTWPWPLFMGWTTYDPQSNPIISYFNKSQSAFDGHKRMALLVPKPVKRKPVPILLQQNSIQVLIQHLEIAVETLDTLE